ncbi:hypothetical protein NBO_38g0014 [Nosema bombycis CQ1]|uniref:Uncharacterized protein n=1 Tax=Nosema bombycis (strain CQ1 / CVCC 102059) TaxID=578461 RepID=R0MML0_NOSB1|nr:hypothetical protein NBO_38g0014 [Nosema bombycis CQ1]|eukprot:EOB14103.1 hypothetical protein NBO_38g0014 [Nosema bombycis CQ1]
MFKFVLFFMSLIFSTLPPALDPISDPLYPAASPYVRRDRDLYDPYSTYPGSFSRRISRRVVSSW